MKMKMVEKCQVENGKQKCIHACNAKEGITANRWNYLCLPTEKNPLPMSLTLEDSDQDQTVKTELTKEAMWTN
jgi:hypothetical protein